MRLDVGDVARRERFAHQLGEITAVGDARLQRHTIDKTRHAKDVAHLHALLAEGVRQRGQRRHVGGERQPFVEADRLAIRELTTLVAARSIEPMRLATHVHARDHMVEGERAGQHGVGMAAHVARDQHRRRLDAEASQERHQ